MIGQGTPAHALDFKRSQDVEGLEVYVDEGRKTYKAAGTKMATTGQLVGPKMLLRGARAAARSRVHQGAGWFGGHPAQLGGVMIVMPDGSLPYCHLSEDASDNPSNDEVLAAARKATGR